MSIFGSPALLALPFVDRCQRFRHAVMVFIGALGGCCYVHMLVQASYRWCLFLILVPKSLSSFLFPSISIPLYLTSFCMWLNVF